MCIFGKPAHGYLRWGADGKVRQLEKLYPQLGTKGRTPAPTSTIELPLGHLDLATVMKVSQAVSREILLENLIDTLMRTAIEQAGADGGSLIFSRQVSPRIRGGSDDQRRYRHRAAAQRADNCCDAARSVLRHVVRTSESVILDDAATQSPFSADPYIIQNRPRSILCLPLINQTRAHRCAIPREPFGCRASSRRPGSRC